MKKMSLLFTGIGLLVGLSFVNASAFAQADNYYKQTCRISSTGEEMVRHQFLTLAYTTAIRKKHCVIAFLKNGGYVYRSDGVLLDDYTPLKRQPHNCSTMECL